jgi:hypothetical protein
MTENAPAHLDKALGYISWLANGILRPPMPQKTKKSRRGGIQRKLTKIKLGLNWVRNMSTTPN